MEMNSEWTLEQLLLARIVPSNDTWHPQRHTFSNSIGYGPFVERDVTPLGNEQRLPCATILLRLSFAAPGLHYAPFIHCVHCRHFGDAVYAMR